MKQFSAKVAIVDSSVKFTMVQLRRKVIVTLCELDWTMVIGVSLCEI